MNLPLCHHPGDGCWSQSLDSEREKSKNRESVNNYSSQSAFSFSFLQFYATVITKTFWAMLKTSLAFCNLQLFVHVLLHNPALSSLPWVSAPLLVLWVALWWSRQTPGSDGYTSSQFLCHGSGFEHPASPWTGHVPVHRTQIWRRQLRRHWVMRSKTLNYPLKLSEVHMHFWDIDFTQKNQKNLHI